MNNQLLKLFTDSKMSGYRLAKESGLSEATIARWTKGSVDLRLSSVEKIAAALGVTIAVN